MIRIDHIDSEQITIAARWLAVNWHVCSQPVTRTLREMFGLNFGDACKALAEGKRILKGR